MKKFCCCKPVPPCPDQGAGFYAQYIVSSNQASGSILNMHQMFQKGEEIRLEGENTIVLPQGYLYLVNYLFLATTEADSYMQIVPQMNGSLRLFYSFFAPSGNYRNTSASGSFTTDEAAESDIRLSFSLTYPEIVKNIDITGSVSVTPLMKL